MKYICIPVMHFVFANHPNKCLLSFWAINLGTRKRKLATLRNRETNIWRMILHYLKEWSSISENEIDRSFDEAIFKIVSATIIVKGILGSIESAAIKCSLIARNSQGHSLSSHFARVRCRSCILSEKQNPPLPMSVTSIWHSVFRFHLSKQYYLKTYAMSNEVISIDGNSWAIDSSSSRIRSIVPYDGCAEITQTLKYQLRLVSMHRYFLPVNTMNV